MQELLSADERQRAARFHFEMHRNRFVLGHGFLRAILGNYLRIDPAAIRFHYAPTGKPSLAAPEGGQSLCFNMSDSGELALYAICLNRRIGIDVECIRVVSEMHEIAKRYFAPEEFNELCSLPTSLQQEGFFRCWTRKEAYLKAIGEGLGVPLDQFVVSIAPKEVARVVSILGDPEEASRWSVRELTPTLNHLGALAVEGHDWRLECWEWTESRSF